MYEREWLELTDSRPMLDFLRDHTGERKLRLFACACCLHVSPWLQDERSEMAIKACEQYADGRIGKKGLSAARRSAFAATRTARSLHTDAERATTFARMSVLRTCFNSKSNDSVIMAQRVAWLVRTILSLGNGASHLPSEHNCDSHLLEEFRRDEQAYRTAMSERTICSIIRDIIGNPFRPVAADPAWLTWRDGTIPKIAQTIYDERRFGEMALLADALEEAGCRDGNILNHCRQPGEHVRGCWVVDLLIGKS